MKERKGRRGRLCKGEGLRSKKAVECPCFSVSGSDALSSIGPELGLWVGGVEEGFGPCMEGTLIGLLAVTSVGWRMGFKRW